jgi:hypothetical protein
MSFIERTSLAENLDRSNIRANYVGIGSIAIGIGFLQYILDKGTPGQTCATTLERSNPKVIV